METDSKKKDVQCNIILQSWFIIIIIIIIIIIGRGSKFAYTTDDLPHYTVYMHSYVKSCDIPR